MKIHLFTVLFAVALSATASPTERWLDPECFAENRAPMRTSFIVFPTASEAVPENDYTRSPFYRTLNGEWSFLRVDRPGAEPEGFFRSGHDDSSWGTMPVPGIFDTPVLGAAVFHQSTFNHLLFENLSATVGLRLDYEKNKIDYNSSAAMNIQMYMAGKPMGKPMEQAAEFTGKLDDDHVQLLPKFALKYDFNKQNNIYATVSRGFRSGGYNIQMFSELLQSALKQRPGAGSAVSDAEIKNLVTYKPEYSWNYEIGSHLSLFDGKLKTDLAAFYMDTRDQQIAKFVESGLGRMMVNAGSSESYGAEVSLTASVNRNLSLNGSYGYTHSTFKKYDAGKSSSDENIDYSGHYVPFVPRHTMNAGVNYSFFFNENNWAQSLTVGLNYTGAGKIYWTEKNDVSQSFYGTLNGRISLQAKALQIDFWGRNLTNKDYTTFYFESMARGFEQRSKPLQFGVDVRYHF